MRFRNRREAGRELGEALAAYADRSDVIVLGLPRGGVPVAFEVARRLRAPMDVFLVRKLGVPGHEELAMGAIAEGAVEVLNEELSRSLDLPRPLVQQVAVRERLEMDRRDRLYRGSRRAADVADRTVILVDDGLTTGSTMEAAIMSLRPRRPARIIAAAPVGARETCSRLERVADEAVCVDTPGEFNAVGLWYENFGQTSDDEVTRLLAESGRTPFPRVSGADGVTQALEVLRRRIVPLKGDPAQYDALLDGIGAARVVLLGEATHGTHEFYRERAFITRRLIVEKGFSAVAVEADWPDAYRVNRYVRGEGFDQNSVEALADFGRFPTWMWRNADVLDFVGWLRSYNETQAPTRRTGFYGLDLYSLRASMAAVLTYLDKVDPQAARRARARYGCFDHFGDEMQSYGYAAGFGLTPSCERDVITQLAELQKGRVAYASRTDALHWTTTSSSSRMPGS